MAGIGFVLIVKNQSLVLKNRELPGKMNNYQKKAREEILKDIKIKCRMCESDMYEVIDLYDNTICGFSCPNCPNYILYDSVTTDTI